MEPEKKLSGAAVGLIIIIIILILGGIYIWHSKVKSTTNTSTGTENVSNSDANDLNSLDEDVNNTDASTGVDASVVN